MAKSTSASKRSKNAERMAARRLKRKNAGEKPYSIRLAGGAVNALDEVAALMTGNDEAVATAPDARAVLEDLLPALVADDVVSLAEQRALDGGVVSPSAAAADIIEMFARAAAHPAVRNKVLALAGPNADADRLAETVETIMVLGLAAAANAVVAKKVGLAVPAEAPASTEAASLDEGRAAAAALIAGGVEIAAELQQRSLTPPTEIDGEGAKIVADAVAMARLFADVLHAPATKTVAEILSSSTEPPWTAVEVVEHTASKFVNALAGCLPEMPEARARIAAQGSLAGVALQVPLAVATAAASRSDVLAGLARAVGHAGRTAVREGRAASVDQYIRDTVCHAFGLPAPSLQPASTNIPAPRG